MCGIEALRIVDVCNPNRILHPNCTFQEIGITGDCVLVVEGVESEDALFNALKNEEATSAVSFLTTGL